MASVPVVLYFPYTASTSCSLKIGGGMNKKETVKRIMKDNGGIAKTADFVAEGLTTYEVATL